MSKYLDIYDAYSYDTLVHWYIKNVMRDKQPIWTEEHLRELNSDFYIVPRTASVTELIDPSKTNFEYVLAGKCQECNNVVNLDWDYCPYCGTMLYQNNSVHLTLESSTEKD